MLTIRNLSHDPFYNQAFEEYIYQTFPDDDIFLSLAEQPGRRGGACYQNICREVHVEALRRLGIPVVRRMTGRAETRLSRFWENRSTTHILSGRTADGIMMMCWRRFIAALMPSVFPPEKNRGLRHCHRGFENLRQRAENSKGAAAAPRHTAFFLPSSACWIRLPPTGKTTASRAGGTQSAICTVTNIREHLASPMTIEEFQDRLLGQMVPPGSPHLTLTAEQEAEVCRLRDEKYRSWEWTWGKTPAFTYEKSGQFHDAPIRVAYQAKRGIVSSAVIDCDAYRRRAGDAAAQRLALRPGGVCRSLPPTGRRWGGGIDGLAHVKLL